MKSIMCGDDFMLTRGRMTAKVLTPWSRLYQRTRFNHSAFVADMRCGDFSFTVAERDQATGKSTGGLGLCSEYVCPAIEEASSVGQPWLKPGVGILVRTAQRWNRLDETVCGGLPTELVACRDTADFFCRCEPVAGYAYEERRVLRLGKHALSLEVNLKNTGEHTLDLFDYCHNFVSLNGSPTDEHCHMELPGVSDLRAAELPGVLSMEPGGLTWKTKPEEPYYLPGLQTRSASPVWALHRNGAPYRTGENVDFHPDRIVLWGTDYCVCAEVYHHLVIKPGETAGWHREWFFESMTGVS